MKKYIRTKDGRILKVIEIDKDWGFLSNSPQTYGDVYIGTDKVIKQADTIEELCDEFVSVRDNCHDHWDNFEEPKILCSESDVYGAIWTDKGLIYVAKMNEKGELELL